MQEFLCSRGFVRSGYFGLAGSTELFRYAGQWGVWWSSNTTEEVNRARDLYFNDSPNVVTSGDGYRFNGHPLRCLSTVIDIWSEDKKEALR